MALLPGRRTHSRAHTGARAVLRWESEAGVFHLSGQALNVSERGLAMETFDAVPELASVSCSVPALELYGRALVRYVRRQGLKQIIGLEFFGTPQFGM